MWHILEISISIILRRKHQRQLILFGNIVKLCDFNNAKHLKIVGSEGTNTNLGNKGGVIFHGNELPLRHLFVKLDGCTTGPQSFSGPIGNAIKGEVQLLDNVKFKGLAGKVHGIEKK